VSRRTFFRQIYANGFGVQPTPLQELQGQHGLGESQSTAAAFIAAMIDGSWVNNVNGGITDMPNVMVLARAATAIITLEKARPAEAAVTAYKTLSAPELGAQLLAAASYRNRFITITGAPQSMTIQPGASAMLSVDAGGAQPLQFQWYKNGQSIT